ncbi:MAG: competence/damage-inducible protein A [Deltaproteobacteria bacterium]|nr:competence/damage-inducible protein A [Deltaproteobacteria bacterium]
MKVGILAIGNELTSGMTQDTNSSFIAREMIAEGWKISAMMSVGDDESSIEEGLHHMLGISDSVVVTGGLGPTADDITTASIAHVFGLNLHTDIVVLEGLKERFRKRNLKWTENNAKQAMFPEGSCIIDNPVGSACGFYIEKAEKIVTVLPGVPDEMKSMLYEGVIPVLKWKFKESELITLRKTIKLFGLTESAIDEAVAQLDLSLPGISIGFYPRFPEIHIVITSLNKDRSVVKDNLELAQTRITESLKKNIFACDYETMEGVVAKCLRDRNMTLSVAESCTGGLISDRLTNIPGSSYFFERGVVAYSNTSKITLLNVPYSTIEQKGAVSKETAIAMAEGIRNKSETDIGLSTTGIAGPAGGSTHKPVGTVFIALSDGQRKHCKKFLFPWNRRRIKEISAQWALEMVRRYLTGRDL